MTTDAATVETIPKGETTCSLPPARKGTSLDVIAVTFVIFLRILVGFQPHSGQDNYHGKENGYGGDYEAQRHWMELTYHLPIGDWYWYDLEYWGLDYPPLTAYVSYVCGFLSHYLVGPDSVAFFTSRGIEDPIHKAYMRGTVLILDILVYCSAIWFITAQISRITTTTNTGPSSLWFMVVALSQPALLLMDHGHFQYNSVSLGFALWSFYYMTKGRRTRKRDEACRNDDNFVDCIMGAILFCLALNFKQMTLYYAPAIFAYLLGRCCSSTTKVFTSRFVSLGITVIIVFILHWWPFVWYSPSSNILGGDGDDTMTTTTTAGERLLHVIHRIFPFQRGLFEGKVSNLWCALSTKPISIRQRIPQRYQPMLALGVTLLLTLPACVKLFQVGQSRDLRRRKNQKKKNSNNSNNNKNEQYDDDHVAHDDWRLLLWGTSSTSLAFFLASFQVHEKSILMVLAPMSLLLMEDFDFVIWFSLVSTWTLWPLICVDRLQVAYTCTIIIFVNIVWMCRPEILLLGKQQQLQKKKRSSLFDQSILMKCIPLLSFPAMVGLHLLEVFVKVPPNLPDLFPVLWSIGGCAMFCISWFVTIYYLFFNQQHERKIKTS